MKTLFWIGGPGRFDAQALRDWHIVRSEVRPGEFFSWEDCVCRCQGEPDAVLVGDSSLPPFVLGVENFPCPTIFYAVDTHIHSWLPFYGQAFDACLVSLRDHLPLFTRARGGRLPAECVLWYPPCAPALPETEVPPHFLDMPKEWDCLFVGTVNQDTTPLRKRFFELLGKKVPIEIRTGNYRTLFPRARLVINICEKGDLNFRVFESMGCGAALLTPRIRNGQEILFLPGEHMQLYTIPGLAERCFPDAPPLTDSMLESMATVAADNAEKAIQNILSDEARRNAMAHRAWNEINSFHRPVHRAATLHRLLENISPAAAAERRRHAADIRARYLKFMYLLWGESLPAEHPLKEAYMRAALGKFPHP